MKKGKPGSSASVLEMRPGGLPHQLPRYETGRVLPGNSPGKPLGGPGANQSPVRKRLHLAEKALDHGRRGLQSHLPHSAALSRGLLNFHYTCGPRSHHRPHMASVQMLDPQHTSKDITQGTSAIPLRGRPRCSPQSKWSQDTAGAASLPGASTDARRQSLTG